MEDEKSFVICLECGARVKRIAKYHLATHGMTTAEYKLRHPGASLVCAEFGEKMKSAHQRRCGNWFSPEARNKVSEAWKSLHASGATGGEHHWTHGTAKVRGERVPVEQLRAELEGYVAEDITIREMAGRCLVSPRTITKYLKRFGLQQGLRRGERSPNWLGGPVDKHRGMATSEYEELQRRVFERDGYMCQGCGATEGRLVTHHIVPYRETQDNSIENLVTLCQSCHMKIELESGAWNNNHVQGVTPSVTFCTQRHGNAERHGNAVTLKGAA